MRHGAAIRWKCSRVTKAANTMADKDIEGLQKDAAAKVQAFQVAVRELIESGQKLTESLWSGAAEATNSRVHEAYKKSKEEMDEALRLMHEKALDTAGVPKEHPAWIWARKR